jgi:hypothetical protein
MKFVNLTPHDVTLVDSNGMKLVFKSSGTVARVLLNTDVTTIEAEVAPGIILTVPLKRTTGSQVVNLPEPQEGVMYIVSYMLANHVKRTDVIAPLTDESATRDDNRNILGVRSFQTFI